MPAADPPAALRPPSGETRRPGACCGRAAPVRPAGTARPLGPVRPAGPVRPVPGRSAPGSRSRPPPFAPPSASALDVLVLARIRDLPGELPGQRPFHAERQIYQGRVQGGDLDVLPVGGAC